MSLLSVVIPTKNRMKYCEAAIKTVTCLGNTDIQIVIQDNSDTDTLREFCASCGYSNLKYNFHPGVLSFVDNFSEAASLADGDYVCMIGDDDGILPGIVDAISLMKEKGYECLVPGLNSVYIWPGDNPIVKGAEKGYLCLKFIDGTVRELDPEKGLQELLKNGGQDYQACDLPRLYHGIVKKTVLDEIYKRIGTYFDGLTPDIFMSTALACVNPKTVRIGYPVIVSGICSKSGSSDSATGRHTGKLSDAPHFRGHTDYKWDEKAPAIYSVESIWAETVMQALRRFGRDDLYDGFSVTRLDGECLVKYPQFSDIIHEHMKKYGVSEKDANKIVFDFKYRRKAARVVRRVFRKPGSVRKYYGVEDIAAAIDLTVKEINRIVR